MTKNETPWSVEQVAALNRYQSAGWMHPFTCPSGHGALLATSTGWTCSGCDYTQQWAHDFMFLDLSNPYAHALAGDAADLAEVKRAAGEK